MISYLIGLILQAGMVSLDRVSKPELDKRQAYYESCLHGTERFLSSRYPQAEQVKLLDVAKKDCDEMMLFIEKGKLWDKVENPAREGCYDSIRLNLKDKELPIIQANQKLFCDPNQK